MLNNKIIDVHGYGIGIAANDPGCGDGPLAIHDQKLLETIGLPMNFCWQKILTVADTMTRGTNKYAIVADLCQQLASATAGTVMANKRFLNLGGDQSGSIGTWSGAVAARARKTKLGLLWCDAHMDAHTPETTETGNIHGMPLAALLGYGDRSLTTVAGYTAKLAPQNVCLFGIRSYESGEARLLQELGVRVYFMEEIQQRGLENVLPEALAHIRRYSTHYGVSIDLDVFDPTCTPGVGCREPGGIDSTQFSQVLRHHLIYDDSFIGAEIVEYNPHHDENNKTLDVIKEIVIALFSDICCASENGNTMSVA